MNGAIYDSTWNVFFKMKFARIYEAMLSTSLGPLDVAAGEIGKTWGEVGLTANYSWLDNKYAVYGKVSTATSASLRL